MKIAACNRIKVAQSIRFNQLIENSELHVFGHCGHWTQIEKRERFVALVLPFLIRSLVGEGIATASSPRTFGTGRVTAWLGWGLAAVIALLTLPGRGPAAAAQPAPSADSSVGQDLSNALAHHHPAGRHQRLQVAGEGGGVHVVTGPGAADEVREVEQAGGVAPGEDVGEGVGPGDEVEVCLGPQAPQVTQSQTDSSETALDTSGLPAKAVPSSAAASRMTKIAKT